MHTKTAKEIAEQRTDFIESFLNQLRKEMVHSWSAAHPQLREFMPGLSLAPRN